MRIDCLYGLSPPALPPSQQLSLSGMRTVFAFQVAIAAMAVTPQAPSKIEPPPFTHMIFAARAVDAAKGHRRPLIVFQVIADDVQVR